MEKKIEERWKVIEIEEAVRRWRGGFLTPRAAMELIEQHIKGTYGKELQHGDERVRTHRDGV